jgi:hypothetical protein
LLAARTLEYAPIVRCNNETEVALSATSEALSESEGNWDRTQWIKGILGKLGNQPHSFAQLLGFHPLGVKASSATTATFVGNLLIQLPLFFPLPDFIRSGINDIVADRSCRSMVRPILNEAISK